MAAGQRTTVQRALLVALLLLALSLLILAGSGVVLARNYKPTPTASVLDAVGRSSYRGIDRARTLHRLGSYLAFAAALAVAALGIAALVERRGRLPLRQVAGALTVPVLALGAWFTGLLLPFDQVAIAAVTVGADYSGVLVAFRDDVRFFIIAGSEVGVDEYRRWVVIHLAVVPALLVGAGVLLGRLTRPSVTELQ